MSNFPQCLAVILMGVVVAGCTASHVAVAPGTPAATAQLSLAPASYGQLPGWSEDSVAQALPAFVKSCGRLLKQPSDNTPLDPTAADADFGRVRDWRPLCQAAAALAPGDEAATRQFFEASFVPVLVGSRGGSEALFTGYWEVELAGSRTREGPYQIPVYRRPPDLKPDEPYLTRAQIDDGALAGKGLEVAWLKSADDLFVLQTQGSGRIRFEDGSVARLVYAANNRRPFVDVYPRLLAQGDIPKADFSEATVRAWMRLHPEAAEKLRRENPAYVFFSEREGDGPVGYQGAVLTAERSLAVDHRYIPLGVPLWLDAHDKYRPIAVERLVVAQDTGDGITGPLRGDFYWGSGRQAQARGSDFYADGQYWVLLPKNVATRMTASLN